MKLDLFQKKEIQKIGQKFDLEFILLFGSRVSGKSPNPESDLDIAVLSRAKPTYNVFGQLFTALSQVFPGENLDLRFLNKADLLFRFQVIKNSQLLFGKENDFNLYKMATTRAYFDDSYKFFPLRDKLILEKQEKLARLL